MINVYSADIKLRINIYIKFYLILSTDLKGEKFVKEKTKITIVDNAQK